MGRPPLLARALSSMAIRPLRACVLRGVSSSFSSGVGCSARDMLGTTSVSRQGSLRSCEWGERGFVARGALTVLRVKLEVHLRDVAGAKNQHLDGAFLQEADET